MYIFSGVSKCDFVLENNSSSVLSYERTTKD